MVKLSVKQLRNIIREAGEGLKTPSRHMRWGTWMVAWGVALADAGVNQEDLPIFDVVDEDMGQLALEKMWGDFFDKGKSPEEAVALAMDRDAFAADYYDPYIDEFTSELEHAGRL